MRSCVVLSALSALLSFSPALVSAQNTTAASTLYIAKTETQFSINLANDTSDVYIYFASPAYSWVGVGFGAQMDKSLMFIMYPNSNGDNVTLSPRIGAKATEPTFSPNIDIELLPGTTLTNDDMMVVHARCKSCRVWPSGFLDDKSLAQPMIYAFGNADNLNSDSKSAGLQRHVRYGHFTMDMRAASGLGGVPANSSALYGVQLQGMTKDHDRANLAHAVMGCLAVFVLWPVNLIIAGAMKNIKIHIGFSIGIVVMLVVSYALGIVASREYIRSKTYTSPHQIIAFLTILPILLLSILPNPAISRLHTIIPKIHTPLIILTFLLLLLIGGLGLQLANQTRAIILGYVAVSLIVTVFVAMITKCIRKRGSAYARAQGRHPGSTTSQPNGAEESRPFALGPWSKLSESRSTSQASLRNAAAPPAYSSAPPYPAAYPSHANSYGVEEIGSAEFGADGQQQQRRSPTRGHHGGGTMPGPQYLLNMHPGVPVNVGRL